MALFRVSNERAQFDAAGNDASDQYGAGIRFTQGGNARVTTGSATNYNQGIPMSATGQVAIVDATAGLPAGTIFHNGLPISGDKVCVSRNATAVVSNGTPYDSAGAVAADINLDLNFIGTDTLNSSVTFTRASSATFVGSNGLIQSATTNTPRFDYDPVTLAAKGLLIEEQRTNLLTYSEQFDNAAWGKTNVTVTANTEVSPDGTTSADTLSDGVAAGLHYIESASQTLTGTYTATVYAKKGTSNFIGVYAQGISQGAFFNLNTGQFTSNIVGAPTSYSITPVGNGWYRVSITFSAATVAVNYRLFTSNDGTTFNYTGGNNTVSIWGAQLEAGSFATSYIPTVASQVTRSADTALINTLSPWYNATEGTVYVDASYAVASNLGDRFTTQFDDGTPNNRLLTTVDVAAVDVGGTRQALLDGGTPLDGAPNKLSFAYKVNDFALSLNGASVVTDASGTIPVVNRFNIGSRNAPSYFNGWIRRITYYPRRLSNAELQAITA